MDTEIYFKCFVACFIGNVLHVTWKIFSLATDYKKANMEFSLLQYFKDDRWALITDILFSFAVVYIADEILASEWLMNKIKIFFLFVGFTGSYVILQIMSVAKKRFRNVVDQKTDKADQIEKSEN